MIRLAHTSKGGFFVFAWIHTCCWGLGFEVSAHHKCFDITLRVGPCCVQFGWDGAAT